MGADVALSILSGLSPSIGRGVSAYQSFKDEGAKTVAKQTAQDLATIGLIPNLIKVVGAKGAKGILSGILKAGSPMANSIMSALNNAPTNPEDAWKTESHDMERQRFQQAQAQQLASNQQHQAAIQANSYKPQIDNLNGQLKDLQGFVNAGTYDYPAGTSPWDSISGLIKNQVDQGTIKQKLLNMPTQQSILQQQAPTVPTGGVSSVLTPEQRARLLQILSQP